MKVSRQSFRSRTWGCSSPKNWKLFFVVVLKISFLVGTSRLLWNVVGRIMATQLIQELLNFCSRCWVRTIERSKECLYSFWREVLDCPLEVSYYYILTIFWIIALSLFECWISFTWKRFIIIPVQVPTKLPIRQVISPFFCYNLCIGSTVAMFI